jgi:hypothetical protein
MEQVIGDSERRDDGGLHIDADVGVVVLSGSPRLVGMDFVHRSASFHDVRGTGESICSLSIGRLHALIRARILWNLGRVYVLRPYSRRQRDWRCLRVGNRRGLRLAVVCREEG